MTIVRLNSQSRASVHSVVKSKGQISEGCLCVHMNHNQCTKPIISVDVDLGPNLHTHGLHG